MLRTTTKMQILYMSSIEKAKTVDDMQEVIDEATLALECMIEDRVNKCDDVEALQWYYDLKYREPRKEDRDQTELNDFLFHILTKRRNHIQAVLPSANFNALEVAIKL
jgi:hypothetical protein